MAFKKGQSGNPSGRKKGSKNMATMEKRGLINYLKEEGADRFLQELNTLEGKEYCKIYKDVIEIAFPKQARIENTGEVDHNVTFGWQK